MPRKPISEKYQALYEQICSCESICVGIRRGDFCGKTDLEVFSIAYFLAGIDYIKKRKKDATVFIICEDPDWARERITPGGKVIYIPGNQKDLPPYDLLRLMYSCKNFVISNSTFIWRAAHLSDAKNKIVVAPHIWRNRYPELYKDIYEDYWILFDGKTGERYGENKDINYCSGI